MCNLWTRIDPKSWDHGSMPCCIACITATVSIWVLTVVQLSFSSVFPQYFSSFFFICACLTGLITNIKYRLWTKVHWTVLAAYWFFNFQAVKLPLFNNSFARGSFFFSLWELDSCSLNFAFWILDLLTFHPMNLPAWVCLDCWISIGINIPCVAFMYFC